MRGQDRDPERADAVIEPSSSTEGSGEWVEIAGAMCREG